MRKLKFEECPKTRVEFIRKYNSDHVFRARAEYTGFKVVFNSVILPDNKVAGTHVR